MLCKDNEARDDMVTPEIADGMEADKDAHVADDVEADIEVVKATAPEAEEEADPAAQAEHTLLFKPNPKDRLAGKLAVMFQSHTHSLLININITCAWCCY